MLKKLLLGVLVVFVILVIAAALNPSEKPAAVPTAPPVAAQPAPTQAVQPAATQAARPTDVPKPTAKPAPTWQKVVEFTGKGIKETETFTITADEWRISWDTKPGEYGAMNFQIYVYKGKSMAGIAANVIGEDKDSTIQRGKGDYYLTINTAQPYTVVIEQRQ